MNNKMKRKISLRIDKNKLKVVTFCVLLCMSNFIPALEAKKTSKSRSKSSSSSSVSTGRVAKPQPAPASTFSNPGSLSYNNYQQKPKPVPSAPVDHSANQRPIGWNVNNNQPAKPAAGASSYPVQNAAKPPYPVQSSVPGAAKPPYPVQGAATGGAKPPYPVQQSHNVHQTNAGAPPPYSGGPPPYSAVNNPNMNAPFNHPPPVYSPGSQGFKPGQPGGYGQPGAFGQPGGYNQAGGYGQSGGFNQPHGYNQGGFGGHPPSYGGGGYHAPAGGYGGLPHGGLQGGGVAPAVNYAPAPSFPIAAIPVGAYRPQSSGIGIGGIAAGVGTGLLAGAAGAAIYNALKPEDRVIYRDREVAQAAAPAAPAAVAPGAPIAAAPGAPAAVAPVAPAAVAPGAAVPPVTGSADAPAAGSGDASAAAGTVPLATENGGVAGVPNTPIIMNNNSTDNQQSASVDGSTPTPLAPIPESTPVPTGKQYFPPPGQYYPATGQYVPPGEYDPATGVFTPGRYIPDTSIFQQGQYDPLTQIFTPGSYDVASGQFVPDPNNGPLNLGEPVAQDAATAVTSQPLNQAPQATSGAISFVMTKSLLFTVLPALFAMIARF